MSDKGSFHSGGFVGGGGASGGDASGGGASGDVCARLDGLAAVEGGAAVGGGDGLSSRVFASTVGLIRRSGAAAGVDAFVDVDVSRVERGLDALAAVERLSAREGFEDMVVSGTVGVLLSRADVGAGVGGGEASLEDRLFASTREMIGVGVGAGIGGVLMVWLMGRFRLLVLRRLVVSVLVLAGGAGLVAVGVRGCLWRLRCC